MQTDSSLLLEVGLQPTAVTCLDLRKKVGGGGGGVISTPLSGSAAFPRGSGFLEPLLTHVRERIHRRASRGHFGPLSASPVVTPACGAGSDPTPPPRAVLAHQRGSKSRRPGCSGNGGAGGRLARGRRGDLGPERAGGLPRLRPPVGLPAGDQPAQLLQRHGRGWAGAGPAGQGCRTGRDLAEPGPSTSGARRAPLPVGESAAENSLGQSRDAALQFRDGGTAGEGRPRAQRRPGAESPFLGGGCAGRAGVLSVLGGLRPAVVSTGCRSCLRKGHCPRPRRDPPAVSLLCQVRTHCSLGTCSAPLPASLPWALTALPRFMAHFQGPSPEVFLACPLSPFLHSHPAGVSRDPSAVLELTPLLAGTVLIITAPETREAPARTRSAGSRAPTLPTCCSPRLAP